jgi:probable Rubsico expression protein CbbX
MAPLPRTATARRRSRKRGDMLDVDATVTLAGESRDAGIEELLTELDGQLVGLLPVKKKVAEIGSLLLIDRARQRFGLAASRPNLHMCFTGPPGTGKTTVALMMADLIHRLGYLEKGQVVHAMRDDLVGEYIGQTAPKTRHVLDRAMGGVLFIDEAYTLYRATDSRDYGQECIDILMQVMENEREKLVVVLAGYHDRMDHFFESNPGMRSRVAHHLDFAAYDTTELLAMPCGPSWCGRGGRSSSPTPAASATHSRTPGCGTPTGWRPNRTGPGPGTTSCAWNRRTSCPTCTPTEAAGRRPYDEGVSAEMIV